MKVFKIRKTDSKATKTFGTVVAFVDPDDRDEMHYINAKDPLDGVVFKMARSGKESAENMDKMISAYKRHIKDLEAARDWFLKN